MPIELYFESVRIGGKICTNKIIDDNVTKKGSPKQLKNGSNNTTLKVEEKIMITVEVAQNLARVPKLPQNKSTKERHIPFDEMTRCTPWKISSPDENMTVFTSNCVILEKFL